MNIRPKVAENDIDRPPCRVGIMPNLKNAKSSMSRTVLYQYAVTESWNFTVRYTGDIMNMNILYRHRCITIWMLYVREPSLGD